MTPDAERETLELDVLFVGGGPASLAGALRLAELAEKAGRPLEIGVVDKARELGDHGLSGAVLDPVSLRELLPDYLEKGCPVERTVTRDEIHYLTTNGSVRVPSVLVPPELHNIGFHTVSTRSVKRSPISRSVTVPRRSGFRRTNWPKLNPS